MDILDIIDEPFEEYLLNKADLKKIPFCATYEISPICNMNCEMCYIVQKKKEVQEHGGLLDIDFWVNLTKEAMKEGLLFVLITGGEPFLYKNFKKLYLKLQSLGVYICINTNGTLIDEEVVSWLKENPPRRLNISLYGSSNEIYDKLCKNPNGFTQVTNAMNLLKANNIMFKINSVLTPENVDDYYGIAKVAEAYRVPLSFSYYMFPSVRKNEYSFGKNNGRLHPHKAAEIGFRYFCDKRYESEIFEALEKVQHSLMHPEEDILFGNNCVSCRAGSSAFWVNWKGEMQPCGMMLESKIDLKSTNFKEAWEFVKEEVKKIKIPDKCAYCNKRQNCYICAAAAFGETGNFDEAPKYLCDLTEEYVRMLTEEYNKRKDSNND